MTTLKDICYQLNKCVERVEGQIRIDINDSENKITNNELGDLKIALEKAKDYHYKEIINILRDILDKIKIIMIHQDKIHILSDDKNIPPQELKRYSYVQRQVNNFSRSEGNLTLIGTSAKRERRRVASEISVEYLDTWEKFLDSKNKEQELAEQNQNKVSFEVIPKRNKSKIRNKKKLVSCTHDGFLDCDYRCSSLDSIVEEFSESEISLEKGCSTPDLSNYYNFIESRPWLNRNAENLAEKENHKVSEIEKNQNQEEINNNEEQKETQLGNEYVESMKPKIVDVVYKKKPR